MGIFDSWFKKTEPKNSITDSLSLESYANILNGGVSSVSTAGINVNAETAVRFTTVLICLRVLAESVASLPCILYKRNKNGGRDRATDHPLYRVLHDQTNSWNTPFEYLEGTMTNLATNGNGYSFVDRNSKGQTVGLIPLNPSGVMIEQGRDYAPVYTVTMPDNWRGKISYDQMHHIRGPLPKGYVGRSMINLAREGIGLGLAAERFGGQIFTNGAVPSGVLKHPKTLTQPAQDRLKLQFAEKQTGEGQRTPLFLEEGAEWVQTSINPDDAQFLETRKFQRAEIAGIFRVPAHFVNDLEKATFSNIEHQSLDFVIHSLRPWLKRWEQAINRDLLAPSERGDYFVEFLIDDLLRGDFKTRMEAFALQIQNGIRSPNEVRAIENLNKREGGDEYWKPAAYADPVKLAAAKAPTNTAPLEPAKEAA